jgi:Ni,Fe-hydrogenase III small subunit/formate hydrogenlyase subunit 6/NADH:ubiquinone oxidoreductase subunit I
MSQGRSPPLPGREDPSFRTRGSIGEVFGPRVTEGYPEGPLVGPQPGARTPIHDGHLCLGEGECSRACPAGAIELTSGEKGRVHRLDYGACLFCRACVDACPTGALAADPFFELAVRDRQDLIQCHTVGSRAPVRPSLAVMREEVAKQIERCFGGSLALREVDAGSCNACEVEVHALTWPTYDLERLGIHFVASPRHADALMVTGPVTRNMRLALEKTYRATPAPKFVVAVGACAISGGPFRGSPEVSEGVASVLPVEVFVPGCPPRPEALLYGLWLALGKVEPRLRQGEVPRGGVSQVPGGRLNQGERLDG